VKPVLKLTLIAVSAGNASYFGGIAYNDIFASARNVDGKAGWL
jgi:hypothetical protein